MGAVLSWLWSIGLALVGQSIGRESHRESRRMFRRIGSGLALAAVVLLTGCVDLDTEVRFGEANHGELVQTLRLDESWQVWGGATAREWRDRWADRARSLGGRVLNRSDRTLTIAIPFHNGRDLQSTFRALSNPPTREPSPDADRADPSLLVDRLVFPSEFQLHQQNWLIAVRNHLRYEVDLRSLAAVGGNQFALVDTDHLLRWRFGLRAPVLGDFGLDRWWRPDLAPDEHRPQRQQGRWVWTLEPGQRTVIEAVFWVPSAVGIGAIGIGLFCAIGWWRWRGPALANSAMANPPAGAIAQDSRNKGPETIESTSPILENPGPENPNS